MMEAGNIYRRSQEGPGLTEVFHVTRNLHFVLSHKNLNSIAGRNPISLQVEISLPVTGISLSSSLTPGHRTIPDSGK
jgi:hypothetical protein